MPAANGREEACRGRAGCRGVASAWLLLQMYSGPGEQRGQEWKKECSRA